MVNLRSPCWRAHRAPTESLAPVILWVALAAGLVSGCGKAGTPAPPVAATGAEHVLCVPSEEGFLRARLQGAIDAELDWASGVPQCRGGLRPSGDGVRLLYKGTTQDQQPLLIVIGVGPLRAGESSRNVPANVTLVREGTGQFFATQGDDKCALDEVRQEPLSGTTSLYRLTGRGYCTQPARALGGGEGSVLVTRFDVLAIVDYSE